MSGQPLAKVPTEFGSVTLKVVRDSSSFNSNDSKHTDIYTEGTVPATTTRIEVEYREG